MGRWFFSDVILTLEKMCCDDPERGQMLQINHKGYLGRSELQKLSGCWAYAQGLNHVSMMKHLQLTLNWWRLPPTKCLLPQLKVSPDSIFPLGMTIKANYWYWPQKTVAMLASSTLRNDVSQQSQNNVIGWAHLSVPPPGWSEPYYTMRKRNHRYFKPSFRPKQWPNSWKTLRVPQATVRWRIKPTPHTWRPCRGHSAYYK